MKNKYKWLSLALAIFMAVPLMGGCHHEQKDDDTTQEETNMTIEETTNTETAEESGTYSLEGKTFIFLGSSVTYGAAAGGYSMADHIAATEHCTVIKEAVSGTTLVDNGESSYVQRMLNQLAQAHKDTHVDHFVVQLSTNDATQGLPLGQFSSFTDKEKFDTSTIMGAIEFIIAYVKETWDCPISFYTGTKYQSVNYHMMVNALKKLQEKWGIGVIDLYNDPDMHAVTDEAYARFMADPVHPTRAGYEEWWTPKFVAHLKKQESLQ